MTYSVCVSGSASRTGSSPAFWISFRSSGVRVVMGALLRVLRYDHSNRGESGCLGRADREPGSPGVASILKAELRSPPSMPPLSRFGSPADHASMRRPPAPPIAPAGRGLRPSLRAAPHRRSDGLRFPYLPDWPRATRKPQLLLRYHGSLPACNARGLPVVSNQLPPGITRLGNREATTGSTTGDFSSCRT